MYIYADFNNRDASGYLRLNNNGTVDDLFAAGISLVEGMKLTVSDGDLVAEIIVHMPGGELVWRGEVVGEISEVEEFPSGRANGDGG